MIVPIMFDHDFMSTEDDENEISMYFMDEEGICEIKPFRSPISIN